ncbi:hypothetical protein CC2G_014265 [Coprinopsis cinerea AmutBmut pab1-1]|nr:hypothetical protein CC2G_014265 [Coprinopsis cinerea AmutBmut pab1-1]
MSVNILPPSVGSRSYIERRGSCHRRIGLGAIYSLLSCGQRTIIDMVLPPFDAALQFASHVIETTGCPFVNAIAFPVDKQVPILAPVPIASTNPARFGLAGINMTSYLDQTPAMSELLTFKLGEDASNSYGRTGYIFELSKDTEPLNPMVTKMAPGSGVRGHMLVVLLDDNGLQVDATHLDIRPVCIGVARSVPQLMSREPFEVVELLELIASLSDWSRRDIAAFRLSGRVPAVDTIRDPTSILSYHGYLKCELFVWR